MFEKILKTIGTCIMAAPMFGILAIDFWGAFHCANFICIALGPLIAISGAILIYIFIDALMDIWQS